MNGILVHRHITKYFRLRKNVSFRRIGPAALRFRRHAAPPFTGRAFSRMRLGYRFAGHFKPRPQARPPRRLSASGSRKADFCEEAAPSADALCRGSAQNLGFSRTNAPFCGFRCRQTNAIALPECLPAARLVTSLPLLHGTAMSGYHRDIPHSKSRCAFPLAMVSPVPVILPPWAKH